MKRLDKFREWCLNMGVALFAFSVSFTVLTEPFKEHEWVAWIYGMVIAMFVIIGMPPIKYNQ